MNIELLDPTGSTVERPITPGGMRHRMAGLDGATIGVLTNMFRGEDLPGAIAASLERSGAIARIVRREKTILSRVAEEDKIRDLSQVADGVIIGVCG